MRVIFRSPVSRVTCILMGFIAGWLLLFGHPAKWHNTTSLRWLDHVIPLGIWGALLIVHSVLLIRKETRPWGYALGFVCYGAATFSLLWTLPQAGAKNIFVIAMAVDLVSFYAHSIKLAEQKKGGVSQ